MAYQLNNQLNISFPNSENTNEMCVFGEKSAVLKFATSLSKLGHSVISGENHFLRDLPNGNAATCYFATVILETDTRSQACQDGISSRREIVEMVGVQTPLYLSQ